jgi:hypothetical protein
VSKLKIENFATSKFIKEWGVFGIFLILTLGVLWKLLPLYIDYRISLYIKNNHSYISDLSARGNSSLSKIDELNLLKKYRNEIFDGISDIKGGDLDRSIVVFSDYNCSFCKSAEIAFGNDLKKVINGRKIIYHELPILSQSSVDVAKLAIVANELGLYKGFRAAMIEIAHPTEQDGFAFFQKAGFSRDRIIKLRDSDRVAENLEKDIQLAKNLKIEGTPAIILNGEILRGWNEGAFRKLLF